MTDWKKLTVGDLCDTISDTYHRKDNNVVLVNTSDVLEGKILNHQLVENKNLKGQFKKTFKKDDILYSEIRPANKRFAYVDFEETENYIASTKLMVLRPKTDVVLPRFLFAYLSSNRVLAELQHLAETRSGTFPQITYSSELAPLPISVPDFDTQEKIVGMISSIEEKIQNNNAINDNLEQQLLSYYNELFVTNAKENWKEGTIADLGKVVGGSTPSKKKDEYYTDQGIAWITPKDLSNNHSKFITHGEIDITELGLANSSAVRMPAGTVLFSSRAPIGYTAIADDEVTTNQGFKSVVPFENIGTAYVYCFLKANLSVIENMASGSTFKEISGSTMKTVPAVIPDEDTLSIFRDYADAIFDQQRNNESENRVLTSIKDSLLPRLMSGDLDVSSFNI